MFISQQQQHMKQHKTKNIKTFQHAIIPSDWEVKELGKLVDEKRPISYGIVQTGELVEGGVPCIRVTDIVNGKIEASNLITTSKKTSDGYKRTLLKKGDLVMALRGKIGQVAKIEDNLVDANLTRGVALIALKENYSNDFVLQQISSSETIKIFEKNLNGSALQELSIGVLRKIKLPFPPLKEQKAIAALLNTWDTAIQKNTTLIACKELHKKWLMQKLLTGKGKNGNHILGNYIKEVSFRNKGNKITRVLSVTNSRGFIDQEEQFDRIVASQDLSNYKIVRKGQFAYNPSRVNVGSLDLLRKFEEGILSPMYVVFEPDTEKINKEYLFYLLKTSSFTARIPMFVQGSVRDTLSFDGLCGMKFFIPSLSKQDTIVQVLKTIDKEIQLLTAKVTKLRTQKKGLTQQLLTGKKRLKI